MSKVAQDVLEEFGRAVKRARTLKGWTLDDLARQITPAPGKSFLSNLEKARRPIGPVTVGKLIAALGLPETWIDRFLDEDIAPEAEETKADSDTDRLLRLHAQDTNAPPASEDLLLTLAAEFASGRHVDPMTAYNDLRAALQAAADLKARGQLPQNTSDQVTLVMQRVSALNDEGKPEEAAAEVDRAIIDLDAAHDAQKSALIQIALTQDRLRKDPEAAAKRLLAQLRSVPHPGGLFRAMHATWEEWYDRGRDQGISFDLNTALHLALAMKEKSKGAQLVQALTDLGLTQYQLGRQEGRNDRLKQSIANFRIVVASVKAKAEPDFWAAAMTNLAMVQQELGAREASAARLEEAIKTCRAALSLCNRNRDPLNWARTQAILGDSISAIGKRELGVDRLEEAIVCIHAALEEYRPDRQHWNWSATQVSLGNVLQELGDRNSGTAHFEEAVAAYTSALEKRPRDTLPLGWAETQNSLGNALWRWGARENGNERIVEAVATYRLALEEWTRDRVPMTWAMAWGNMGEAMTLLADRTDDLAMARQALTQLEEAEEVLRGVEHEVFAQYSADRIPRAKAVIDRLS